MVSVAILEDDPLSSELLVSMLQEMDEPVEIRSVLTNICDAVTFFNSKPSVDLVLSDVQLADGLSFEIFEETKIECPIIFISAYDKYIINAFEYIGIDYLLKPASKEALSQAIKKYKALQNHFIGNSALMKNLIDNYFEKKKTRLLVKRGYSFVSLPLNEIVLFYTENLVVYVADSQGNKYLIDKNLNALEEELDPEMFFRANRQYIVNIDYVVGYKSYERVKLILTLKKEMEHTIVIGQEKAKAFRKWIAEA